MSKMGCVNIISESCHARSQLNSDISNVYLDDPSTTDVAVPFLHLESGIETNT